MSVLVPTLVNDNGKRVLSEINTANVGGFLQIQQTTDKRVFEVMAEELIRALEDQKNERHNR